MSTETTELIERVDRATGRLLDGLGQAERGGLEVSRASLCPGWTAGHILTHLARNADALRRSAEGARRGEAVPMYDSAEARDRDIEAGAGRPMPELVADVTRSAGQLRETWAALTEAAWARDMPHHLAGLVPLRASPQMRLNEVLIHHVDLAWRYGPADWPGWFVAGIMADAPGELGKRLPDGVRVSVRGTGPDLAATAGSGDHQVSVSGPSWALAAWVIGRVEAGRPALSVTGGDLPELASWP
jgi:maleylpyruvate isomerase